MPACSKKSSLISVVVATQTATRNTTHHRPTTCQLRCLATIAPPTGVRSKDKTFKEGNNAKHHHCMIL
jgi:hypothetical protein